MACAFGDRGRSYTCTTSQTSLFSIDRVGISVCKARRAVSNNIQLKLKFVCSFICFFNKFLCPPPPPRPKFINTVQCFVRIVSKNGIHVVLHILNLIYYQAGLKTLEWTTQVGVKWLWARAVLSECSMQPTIRVILINHSLTPP